MKPVVGLACAAFALAMLGSPLGAQDMPVGPVAQSEQPAPDVAPPAPAPEVEQLPPPPPFPPMPSARPSHRWVDVGGRHASRTRHHARKSHATPSKHRRAHAKHRTAHKAKPMHFSRKTIRSCHGMSYRQIMRHPSCRALMKQELAAPAHRHRATHHKATRHKASAHNARRHHSAKRRR